MGRLTLALAFALALGAIPGSASCQALRGLLRERDTELPIELGTVVLVSVAGDSVASTLTGENGYFAVSAKNPGRFYLVASALGYRSVRSERMELEDGVERIVQLHLALRPLPVQGVVVEADAVPAEVPELIASGFYDRLREGHGEFLTPEAIAAHPGAYTTQLFREMTLVYLMPMREGGIGPWSDRVMIRKGLLRRGLRGGEITRGLCEPYVYVDDVLRELSPGESLEDLVPKGTLEAVEVFEAPWGAPLRYFRNKDCGAILLWTTAR